MSHTKGEWEIHPALADGANHVRICAGVEEVARVGSIDHPWAQTVADARLIAAAPEMLELLQGIARWDMLDSCGDGPYWKKAIALVINKATAAQEGGK